MMTQQSSNLGIHRRPVVADHVPRRNLVGSEVGLAVALVAHEQQELQPKRLLG